MQVVARRHDGVRLLALLVVEISTVLLERAQQCHDIAEDLLVSFGQRREPPLEQRVVPDLQEMQCTTYVIGHIAR